MLFYYTRAGLSSGLCDFFKRDADAAALSRFFIFIISLPLSRLFSLTEIQFVFPHFDIDIRVDIDIRG
jgi:hypothetical protein